MSQRLHWTQQQYDDYLRRHNLPQRNTDSAPIVETPPLKPKGRQPNKTEAEFGLILEAMKRKGDIWDYRYEGVTLLLADGCRFTPDFFIVVSQSPLRIRFCETKGAHIWDDAKVKFRVARGLHGWAEWEMHQKKGGSWIRLF